MKLRNKKTGEIRNAVDIDMYTESVYLKVSDGEFDNETIEYHSLAELNADWEDYEEMKGYWYINEFGTPTEITHTRENIYDKQRKNFGNRFETKEEAEKAVEKLRALKRLERKGLKFKGVSDGFIGFWFPNPDDMFEKNETRKDLDLLFGGEE